MFSLKQAVVLALVGSSFAKPIAHWSGRHRDTIDLPIGGRMEGTYDGNDKVVVVYGTQTVDDSADATVYVTVTATATADATPAAAAAATVTATPAAAAATGSAGSSSSSSGTGYMAVVNKWRATMGRAAFTQSSQLEANALKTANDGNGKMVHELNPGSFGQVLAPGNANNFESVFVGGWLCEMPSLPGLSAVCPAMSQGWSHDGETGHAQILSSTSYTKIGCALAKGIWACDVA